MAITPEEFAKMKQAPAWRPDSADKYTDENRPWYAETSLASVPIAAILKRTSEYGDYPCVIFAVPDEDSEGGSRYLAWHVIHQTAKDALQTAKPRPGEVITVSYGGRVESKKRRNSEGKPVKYHLWSVVCENTMEEELGYDPYAGADDTVADATPTPKSRVSRSKSTQSDEPGF